LKDPLVMKCPFKDPKLVKDPMVVPLARELLTTPLGLKSLSTS
jgi:hypothetical protein